MELQATRRTVVGKAVQKLRKAGKLPAVVYGAKDEAVSIELPAKDFAHAFREAGESTVIELSIDGEKKNVLIHEVDLDPITNEPRHADFYAVQKGQKIEIEIPLVFSGESPAAKELGANVIKVLHDVEVEAEVMNIPHELVVDIGVLTTLESQIIAKDIRLPEGVTLVTEPEEVIATVAMPEEEPEEPAAAPDMESIGISEERGKKEEEGGEGAGGAASDAAPKAE